MHSFEATRLVAAIEDTLHAVTRLADEIVSVEQAQLPTDCPGWTVHDQFAHIVGLEQVLNGEPEPDIILPPLSHVKSGLDRYMECHVHIRRPLPFRAVADELVGFVPRRMEELRRLVAKDPDPMVKGPFGERPLSVSLPVRVFDLWAHEQDIRRALGMAARIDCDAAHISVSRAMLGWSKSLDATLAGVNGQLTVRAKGVEMDDVTVRLGSGGPAVLFHGDVGQLTREFCGRGEPDRSLLTGDKSLVEALHGKLGLTP